MSISPVFILSLPRSGSTLLQRLLATHPAISTASEPWILLPVFYARKESGTTSEYNFQDSAKAVNDFISTLRTGEEGFNKAIRTFALSLYEESAEPGAQFFVDKTPRYHLIFSELRATFPNAKFIILWRNPLAIAASMMNTWSAGRWNLHRFEVDLYRGLDNLLASQSDSDESTLVLNYESLISFPDHTFKQLFDFLGLHHDRAMPSEFSEVDLQGRMGDPTGVKRYNAIEPSAADNWPSILNNPVRKIWANRYLNWIGQERLQRMGYDKNEILQQLDRLPIRFEHTLSDIARIVYRKLMPTPEQRCLHLPVA